MNDRGFFLVHRRGWLWQLPPKQFKLAFWILKLANYESGSALWTSGTIHVPRGSFITSLRRLSSHSETTTQCVRSALLKFEKCGFITMRTTNQFRLITITNYDYWQTVEQFSNKQDNKPATSEQQASNKRATTIQEVRSKEVTNNKTDLSFSLESDSPKPKRRKRVPQRDPATLAIVGEVVAAFNETFGRSLGLAGFYEVIERCLGEGYTGPQLRGVVWWAAYEWTEDHEYRAKLSPATLFKLRGSNRTFPTYLALATEHWPKVYPGKDLPWPNQ